MGEYGIKTPPQHGTWDEFLAVWQAADQIELFESAWTMDHFYPLTPPLDGEILESWTMLAALAQATTRLRIGSMVNGMHYRHPAVTANMAVTTDLISNGRFSLGLGAGWFEPESDAYGMPLGTLTERFDRFDEGLEVIVSLLTNESTTFHGKYYDLDDARCEPKSHQRPHPPIVIGGKGPKRTLRAVARWADHWDMTFPESPDQWSSLNEVLLSHCADIGRDPSDIRRSIHTGLSSDTDPEERAAFAQPFFEAGVDLVIYSMRGPYEVAQVEQLATSLSAY
jgi:F420-dependent oxidoreductase-like protein